MDGKVLHGQFAGKLLSELPLAQLMEVWKECRAQDVQSARLLEAYLDRAAPDWRGAAGQSGASGRGSGAAPTNGRMTPDEAYEVLGLSPGAGAPEVRRAHRELMKKLHPDRGGSTYLAAKINQAKDVLLSARR
jgi:DnaJ-domain-containing protein 1